VCGDESEKDRGRRVTPPVSSTFIAPALPHSPSPFSSFPLSLSLFLSLLSCLASQHTLSPIMPVSLRPLSSHSLRLPLTTEQPQESMHPGSLLPAANDPTFQAFSFSVSPLSSFSLPVSISLSLSLVLLRSSLFLSLSLSHFFLSYLSILLPLMWPIYVSACTLNLHTHQHRYATSVRDTGELIGHRPV